jgi:GNAT superfamily N-acetyltransferase
MSKVDEFKQRVAAATSRVQGRKSPQRYTIAATPDLVKAAETIGNAMYAKLPEGEVEVEPASGGNGVEIVWMRAGTEGRGDGTRAMQAAIDAADKLGVRLALRPDGGYYEHEAAAGIRLREFYSRFGFKLDGDRDMARDCEPKMQPFQVVTEGRKAGFDLSRPYVLAQYIPLAAAVPGTDMGEQSAGDRYLQRGQTWVWSWSQATRYTEEEATVERERLLKAGCIGVEMQNANVLEARLQVMMAVSRGMQDRLSRIDFRAEIKAIGDRLGDLSDDLFVKAVQDLATRGELTEASILSASGLGAAVVEESGMHEASKPTKAPFVAAAPRM